MQRKEKLASAIAPLEIEEARIAASSADNALAQAEQDVMKADLALSIACEQIQALTVRAPISGIVTRIDAHIGDTALDRSDSVREQQSLLAITDPSSLGLDADVAETNLSKLTPGLLGQATFDAFPDRPFAVELLYLAPTVSREKGTIDLCLRLIESTDEIRPGMAARIHLINEGKTK